MTRDDMIAFENTIADEFNAGRIPHPVHLESGNEDALIAYFDAHVKPGDWLCVSWRGHLKCLLHGVPAADLKAAIMRGESIALNFPAHRIVGSAIVGGTVPIAVGIAMGIKRAGGPERVHCFVGDMTARTGIFMESREYAYWHDLPLRWVVEDNGKSVCTDTLEVWAVSPDINEDAYAWRGDIHYYAYTSKWPHAGAGVRVQF